MKHSIFYYLVFFIFCLATSCSNNDTKIPSGNQDDEEKEEDSGNNDKPSLPNYELKTEKGDNFEVTYQYKKDVRVLEENKLDYIVQVESDSVIYFSDKTPTEYLPVAGRIYSAGYSEKTPYGLGNKVISVSKTNGLYKCVTTVAPLSDIFEDLKVKANLPLMGGLSDGFYDNDSVYHEVVYEPAESSRATINVGTWKIKIGRPAEEGENFSLAGYLYSSLTLNIDLDLKHIENYDFSLTATTGLQAEVSGEYAKEVPIVQELLDVSLKLPAYWVGPLAFRPSVQVKSKVSASVGGTVQIGLDKKFTSRFGFNYGGGYYKIGDDIGDPFNGSIGLNGSVALTPSVNVDLLCGLYTSAFALGLSPEISFPICKAEISSGYSSVEGSQGDVALAVTGEMNINGKMQGKILKFDIFEKELELLNWTFLDLKIPLLSMVDSESLTATENKESETDEKTVSFDVAYQSKGGLLCDSPYKKNTYPAVIVYEKESKKEVFCKHMEGEGNALKPFAASDSKFTVPNLKYNTTYTAIPATYMYFPPVPPLKEGTYEYIEEKEGIDFRKDKDTVREYLIQLYHDTDGDHWVNKTNWCSDKPINEWYGIKYHDGLLRIELPENNLNGPIDLSGCKELESLKISNKRFDRDTVTNNKITSLNVEGCIALKWLGLFRSQLTSLDISHNPNLQVLDCGDNQLNSLDVSHNPKLHSLDCDGNQLSSLDVSHNPRLSSLDCGDNQLSSLDVSHNPNLWWFVCDGNQLSSLDISHNPYLTWFVCDGNQLSTLDVSHNPNLGTLCCSGNQLNSLDVSYCQRLEDLRCNANKLTNLNVLNCDSLKIFHCRNNNLNSLDISNNKLLLTLKCDHNNLTSIKGLDCVNLGALECDNNQLSSLDVSKCYALEFFSCSHNQITSLVFGSHPNLEHFYCESNKITREIPHWFKQIKSFKCDFRYKYGIYSYQDHGTGWWYPGEPESRRHGW